MRVADSIVKERDLQIALHGALQRAKSQRVCQVIVNATGRADPFYVEDDELIAALNGYCLEGAPPPE